MSEELLPRRLVKYGDGDSAVDMEVYIELEVDGRSYALLFSTEIPVHVVRTVNDEGEDMLDPISDEELIAIQRELDDSLKPWGVRLALGADEVRLVGEPSEDFLDDCAHIQVRSEDGDEEHYAVVVELDSGNEHLLVITPLIPDLTPVELVGDKARRLEDDELSQLEEIFHMALSETEGEA
jgi:hypothetical protein